MDADDSENQMPRNLEAPDYLKDFEETLNQVKNLIPPVNSCQLSSNIAVVTHYLTRLGMCKSGRADDERNWAHSTTDVYGNKEILAVCLSTPSAYVAHYIGGGTGEVADYFKELHSYLEPRFSNEECVICSQESGFNQIMWRLPCAHEMHYHCCLRWMRISKTFSCPICRTVVTMDESGFDCKGGACIVRSPPIMASILNYISYDDLKRWQDAYTKQFKRKHK